MGKAVRAARKERGWRTIPAFVDVVGRSARTIGKLERGEARVSEKVLHDVEDALGWPRGSLVQLRDTGKLRVVDPERRRVNALWPRLDPNGRRSMVMHIEGLLGIKHR